MGYPFWVTTNNLGTQPAGFSLTSSPILLVFGESENLSCTVQLLNGALPTGVTFSTQSYTTTLKGELPYTGETVTYQFTLRVSNGRYVADRTFTLTVTEILSVFEWVTTNSQPLLYVYDDVVHTADIQARSVPLQTITYACTNITLLTKGISLVANSGQFTVDLSWKPLTAYSTATDYVYSNNQLYVCAQGGTSSSTQGPHATGTNVVDSSYSAWQAQRYYSLDAVVTNDVGKVYICTQPGISNNIPNTGPTGTGNYIIDGIDDNCIWA